MSSRIPIPSPSTPQRAVMHQSHGFKHRMTPIPNVPPPPTTRLPTRSAASPRSPPVRKSSIDPKIQNTLSSWRQSPSTLDAVSFARDDHRGVEAQKKMEKNATGYVTKARAKLQTPKREIKPSSSVSVQTIRTTPICTILYVDWNGSYDSTRIKEDQSEAVPLTQTLHGVVLTDTSPLRTVRKSTTCTIPQTDWDGSYKAGQGEEEPQEELSSEEWAAMEITIRTTPACFIHHDTWNVHYGWKDYSFHDFKASDSSQESQDEEACHGKIGSEYENYDADFDFGSEDTVRCSQQDSYEYDSEPGDANIDRQQLELEAARRNERICANSCSYLVRSSSLLRGRVCMDNTFPEHKQCCKMVVHLVLGPTKEVEALVRHRFDVRNAHYMSGRSCNIQSWRRKLEEKLANGSFHGNSKLGIAHRAIEQEKGEADPGLRPSKELQVGTEKSSVDLEIIESSSLDDKPSEPGALEEPIDDPQHPMISSFKDDSIEVQLPNEKSDSAEDAELSSVSDAAGESEVPEEKLDSFEGTEPSSCEDEPLPPAHLRSGLQEGTSTAESEHSSLEEDIKGPQEEIIFSASPRSDSIEAAPVPSTPSTKEGPSHEVPPITPPRPIPTILVQSPSADGDFLEEDSDYYLALFSQAEPAQGEAQPEVDAIEPSHTDNGSDRAPDEICVPPVEGEPAASPTKPKAKRINTLLDKMSRVASHRSGTIAKAGRDCKAKAKKAFEKASKQTIRVATKIETKTSGVTTKLAKKTKKTKKLTGLAARMTCGL
ncbi:hypothetical protein CC80DRAFT_555907 [Byssothecium circinans]|uniref:Uncharacterized protein n=1 Tax=Byssothecium circinans TaxID=147558 RepID=A0A6A5T9L5_9PLEO|nr:hypothetical protein CC80DRAFT_555907 [Byssothecium circinans]